MKNITFICITFTLLLSACGSPQPAPTATPLPTNTPLPASTSTATPVSMIDVDGVQVPDPKVSNPELFDLENSDSPIVQFANAFGVKPEEVGELKPELKTGIDGKQFVVLTTGDLFAITNFNESGTPLLIAEQIENGEWVWKVDPRYLQDRTGITVNVSIEERTSNELDTIKNSFNGAFVGYDTEWRNIEPKEGQIMYDYEYAHADKNIKWARENNMKVFAGPLFFVDTYPDWIKDGNFTKDQLEQFVVRRTKTLMEHYKGQVDVWIGLNEYFPNQWSGIPYDIIQATIGYDRYLELVYTTAQSVDPNAVLIYNAGRNHTQNDGDRINGINYQHTVGIIKKLQALGIKTLGVGLQMHIDAKHPPSKEEIIKTMKSYGVPVYITEFDVNLENIDLKEPNRLEIQANIYKQIVDACIETGVCNNITIFQIIDQYSWLETNLGKTNADPTPFDNLGNPKPAYYAIQQALLESAKAK